MKSRDPIPTFTTYLQARNVLPGDKLKEIEGRVASTIDEAVEFAINAPDPRPGDAVTDSVYVARVFTKMHEDVQKMLDRGRRIGAAGYLPAPGSPGAPLPGELANNFLPSGSTISLAFAKGCRFLACHP